MLISRGMAALKATRFLRNKNIKTLQSLRNSHDWNYRTSGDPPPKIVVTAAEIVQGVAWWWVLWHLYTEPDHILGEFGAYADPRNWTDEELGIPPEDE